MNEVVERTDRRGSEESSLEDLLKATGGLWKGSDGLTYQLSMRSEWEEEPCPRSQS